MSASTSWSSDGLPEPPARPDWLGESAYSELHRAHIEALTSLTLAEAFEAEARRRRVTANRAATHYEGELLGLTQLTFDDLESSAHKED